MQLVFMMLAILAFFGTAYYYKKHEERRAAELKAKREEFDKRLEHVKQLHNCVARYRELHKAYEACKTVEQQRALYDDIVSTLTMLHELKPDTQVQITNATGDQPKAIPIKEYLDNFKAQNAPKPTPVRNKFTIIEGGKNEYLQ